MNDTPPNRAVPIEYQPSFEHSEEDNAADLKDLLKVMAEIRQKTYADTKYATRSAHAKSHGLLKGQLVVAENLPQHLAQGLFSTPGTYPVIARLSSSPGDILPDNVSAPKGFALKVLALPGQRLPGLPNDAAQDFVTVGRMAAFQTSDIKTFTATLKPLAAGVDKGEALKGVVSSVLRTVEKGIEAVGGKSGNIANLGGELEYHILGQTFFSQVPILFGKYMAKISIAPVSPELTALTNTTLHAGSNPVAIREGVQAYFAKNAGTWEIRAQLCTDIKEMPIEDAAKIWDEKLSPYVKVATLTFPQQAAWNEQLAKDIDDGMSFSPWHALAAHRPLGSIQRARKPAYEQSAAFRHEHKNA